MQGVAMLVLYRRVQCIYGILKMKIVGGSVIRPAFRNISSISASLSALLLFGQQLCPFKFKHEMLVAPVVIACIVYKLVQKIEGGVRFTCVFVCC